MTGSDSALRSYCGLRVLEERLVGIKCFCISCNILVHQPFSSGRTPATTCEKRHNCG